ncbi:MAG: FKBP-type peptidyl-prolyl cis-trans isomerase [Muribaculaceae bacterium]|nr:FKBP-type peptidyl-prolyl cis-trans isomerase [Muribaculaceae bacterium]
MKKILAIAAAGLLTVGFVGCNSKAGGSSEAMDSLSMAFGDLYGAGMGQQLRSMDSTVNIDQALRGMEFIANADTSKNFQMGLQMGMQIAQLYQGIEQQCGMPINKSLFMKHLREAIMKTTPMGQEEIMAIQSKIEPLLNKAMEQSPKAIANKKAGEEYMAKLKKDNSYTFTKSGIAYKVLAAGEGKNFSDSDVVKVNYEGRHLNGEVFDKSGDQPVPFNLKQVIPGFAEMIQLMKPGSKVTVVIPGELAYGPQGNRGIDPNETLIFDIETLGVDDSKHSVPQMPRPAVRPAK